MTADPEVAGGGAAGPAGVVAGVVAGPVGRVGSADPDVAIGEGAADEVGALVPVVLGSSDPPHAAHANSVASADDTQRECHRSV